MLKKIIEILNPSRHPGLSIGQNGSFLPTLWLLGKTGAGKSSLIQALTGDSEIEIGNGFQPCTKASRKYDFPKQEPLLRFLDTRGLGEAHYDAHADIEACGKNAHALLLVMKAEEPEQSSVLNALKAIRRSKKIRHLLVVHTGIMQIETESERKQCVAHNQQQAEHAWGKTNIASVEVEFDMPEKEPYGMDELKTRLIELLPVVSMLGVKEKGGSEAEQNYLKLRASILAYASASAGSDLLPAVGLASVPILQVKMLHSLANQYGICWDRRTFAEFLGALGTGFSVQYLSKLGLRQLAKLVPVYGQTAGAATASVVSFMTTYALGRTACHYFYARSQGATLRESDLKKIYVTAFTQLRSQGAK